MKKIQTIKRNNRIKRRVIIGITVMTLVCVLFFTQYIYGSKNTNSDIGNNIVKVEDTKPVENNNDVVNEPKDTITNNPDSSQNINQDKKVKNDYFSDAVFIGDSRTQGLMLYTGLKKATFYAEVGLQVDTIFTKQYITKPNGENITILEDLSTKKFSKVYIMLGINELGWVYDSVFISKYEDIIKAIRKINVDAIIYVQSIVYVTKEKSDNDKIYNNKNVERFNCKIIEMCEKNNVKYLDVNSCLKDENNCLPAGASLDGVHLNKEYCNKWLDYLKQNI